MNSVRVRMYRQGLGDCFLLTFTVDAAPHHVLIDCGVLQGTADAAAAMQAVASDIRQTTGGHLDALVVTHEHWDHLSGFLQAEDAFAELTVGEVLLAWTEKPDDDLATELRSKRVRALRAVVGAERALRAAEHEGAGRLRGLLGFYGELGVGARRTTARAMQWVKDRGAPISYRKPGEVFSAWGVRVFVLGPPHDRASIMRSDPGPARDEVYELANTDSALGFFAAAEAKEAGAEPGLQPFEGFFRLDEARARGHALIEDGYYDQRQAWRRIDHDWLAAANQLALKLDSDTNNTSLVLAFELGDGRVLLFPGDAQVGNWTSWEALEWTTDAGPVRAADLLARTVLYKVGHHGSHNATLRAKGLELMTSGELVAMIPVNRATAQKQDWNMPLPSLLQRLQEKTKGRVLDAELGRGEKPAAVGADEWERFLAQTDVQTWWVDYTVQW